MPFQYAQTTYVNAVLSPDVHFVFVINVYSVRIAIDEKTFPKKNKKNVKKRDKI